MSRIRWGVIGTADIAKTKVIPAILNSDYAEVAAIASRGDKAKDIAERFSIPKFYDSYHKLLMDQEIEAVYIPLPNHLHKQWVTEAAKHGKHVLVEKPAALTAEETQEMMDCCRENNVIFMEAFMYQFHPQHLRVREIVTSGEIGEIKFMRASFSYFLKDELTNIRMKKKMGGGSIYDIGSYCIHSIRNIMESEPVRVEAFAELDPRSGIDRSAIVYIKLENGINTVFDCSFDMSFRQEYEIVGTKGRITVPAAYRPDVSDNAGVILIESVQGKRSEMVSADQFKMQIDHFSQAVIEGYQPKYSAENTLKNMRAIDACYQSIESRAAVTLV
ncbi:Gfo/Idh/MocA family oxidoreductase [Neobacillus drentensis]|uniref:Gfo/Idh/MocA family protein n=1 Tax=Neobacillus drentensis TaxID=220684 RepID=UPI002FFFC9B5